MKKFRLSYGSLIALSVGALCNSSLGNDARGKIEARIQSLLLEVAQREKDGAPASDIAALRSACDRLSTQLAATPFSDQRFAEPSDRSPDALFGTLPPGTNATTSTFSAPGFGVAWPTTFVQDLPVSGLDPYLWDVDLVVSLSHPASGDLAILLTSPSGRRTTISTANGGQSGSVFASTVFDDDASELTTDHVYVYQMNVPTLVPEGALATFVGENPNGIWTLTIGDDVLANSGQLNSWSLRLTTLTPSPVSAAARTFENHTPLAIPDHGPVVTSSLLVSMPGTCICDLDLQTFLTHSSSGDLSFDLRSPSGTVVQVSTGNGGFTDNLFNGTLFDDDAALPVTDSIFGDTVMTPEGAFGAFHGENPNGVWQIRLRDDVQLDLGVLNAWNLRITTCSAPPPEPFCFGDGSGTECPCHNNSPLGSKRGCVNGLGLGAKLTGSGIQSVSADSVQLTTEDTPFLSYVLYWQSRYTPNAGLGSAFDDGLLCSQTPVLFLGSRFTDASRKTHFPEGGTPLHMLGGVPAAGGTRFIQAWYRDAGNVCGTHNNLTNGLKVNWVP